MRTWLIAIAVAAVLAPATVHAKPLVLVVAGARAPMHDSCVDCGHGRRRDYLPVPPNQKAYDAGHAKALKDAPGLPPETVYAQGLDAYTRNEYYGDRAFGIKLMELAAERGNEAAERKLIEAEPDADKVCYWAEQVAQKGAAADWLAAAKSCNGLYDPLHQAHALGWYNLAAEAGDVSAQLALAGRFTGYTSPQKDLRLGRYWYVRAAEAGNTYAMYSAADLYMGQPDKGDPGSATLQDRAQAVSWYKRAAMADNGDGSEAVHKLCKWSRDDISPNRGDAMAACLAAYERNRYMDRDDLVALAYALFKGDGLPRDYARALEISKRSPGPETNYYRGQIFAFGLGGVPADPAFGWHLIENAAESGNSDAADWLKSHAKPADMAADLDLTALPAGQYSLSVTLNGKAVQEAEPAAALIEAVAGAGSAVYPERAVNDEVEGSTALYCRWTRDGAIGDCQADLETPFGYGFAQAATRMLKGLTITPRNTAAWNTVVAGKASTFVVRFWLQ